MPVTPLSQCASIHICASYVNLFPNYQLPEKFICCRQAILDDIDQEEEDYFEAVDKRLYSGIVL
jgi:hypothetical protein